MRYEFTEGMRVRMKQSHQHYEQYRTQHEGREGTVREDCSTDYDDDYIVKVRWDNGHDNTYFPESLTILGAEGVIDSPVIPPIKTNSVVIVNPEHEDCEKYLEQHQGDLGTVVKTRANGWIEVLWQNGGRYCYQPETLIVISEGTNDDTPGLSGTTTEGISFDEFIGFDTCTGESSLDATEVKPPNKPKLKTTTQPTQIEDRYELPWFPGTRVCLRKSHSGYADNKEAYGCETGVIIDPKLSDNDLVSWNEIYKSRADVVSVLVLWDSGDKLTIRLRAIEKMDEPLIDIKRYKVGGYTFYLCDDSKDSDERERMDIQIITYGGQISEVREYNKEWRENIIKRIKERK